MFNRKDDTMDEFTKKLVDAAVEKVVEAESKMMAAEEVLAEAMVEEERCRRVLEARKAELDKLVRKE
jgi:hypothetical protein